MAFLLTAACSGGLPEVSETPRRDLAATPAPVGATTPAATQASAEASATPTPPVGPSPTSTPGPGTPSTTGSPAAAPPYRVVAVLDDGGDDQGIDGPSYADLRQVRIEDDGTRARVTVTVGGTLPNDTAIRESVGIGVDLYAGAAQAESDYQLFADGGPDGWFAYLQTPEGFVRYPGTFSLYAGQLVFTVPWASVGGRSSGAFSAFADWSDADREGTLGGNASSHDEAPALGLRRYSR